MAQMCEQRAHFFLCIRLNSLPSYRQLEGRLENSLLFVQEKEKHASAHDL